MPTPSSKRFARPKLRSPDYPIIALEWGASSPLPGDLEDLAIRIQTRDNEPVEKALRRLRKLCNNEGVTRTSKAKKYF
ncbi:MAG: hypothetical protein ACI9EF_003305, partial [Pseudohongiellaceae bacterium]